jgi:hypothetical protein
MPDRLSDLRYRLHGWWSALRHPWRRWGPRCAAPGPWRLPDCGTCCLPRGHERWMVYGTDHADWHADGTGYLWTATQWAWRGPILDLDDLLRDDPARDTWGDQYAPVFTEDGQS